MSQRTTPAFALVAGLVAGCASDIWQPPAYETAMKTYYEDHASEKNGRCWAPYIDGFTRVTVIEDDDEQMVIEASYLYRDWVKDLETSEGGGRMRECTAYNSRRFVLAKSDGRLEVVEMGPGQRG